MKYANESWLVRADNYCIDHPGKAAALFALGVILVGALSVILR